MTVFASTRRGEDGGFERTLSCSVHGVFAFPVEAVDVIRAAALEHAVCQAAGDPFADLPEPVWDVVETSPRLRSRGPSGGLLDVRRHWYEARLAVWRLRCVLLGPER